MHRTLLAVSLVLIPGWALAAKNEAQIKAVKAQIDKAHHDETGALKQIDEQSRSAVEALKKSEEHEKKELAGLEHEEKETLKHIDEKFEHIIKNLAPKEVHHQLEEILKTLEHIRVSVSGHNDDHLNDDLNFHGRGTVMDSVGKAEKQVKEALHHDTPEERRKADEAIQAAHKELDHCLSMKGVVKGPEKGTAQGAAEIAATTQLLHEDVAKLEHLHHLLQAVDHEIKDYEHEKKELLKKKEDEKKHKREEFHHKREHLEKEIHQQQEHVKQLEHQKEEHKATGSN